MNDRIYYFPFKYKTKNSITAPNEFNIIFRLSELFLIRAEARAHQGKLSEAIDDINIIRVRAGLSPLTGPLSQNDVLSMIEKERRVEFFTEGGHRWNDLKRTNRVNDVLSAAKGHKWQFTDHLYPIPQSEINLNSNLGQNPGY